MEGRNKAIFIVLAFIILVSSLAFYFYQVFYSPNILVGKEDGYVDIPTGSDFSNVQKIMSDQHIVNDMLSFSFLARMMKYDRYVKPGRYALRQNMSNREAILLLRSGQQTPVKITYNNIRLVDEIPDKICENIEVSPEELRSYLDSPAIYEKYGFDRENFIGMFIPNTYEVYWTIKPQQLLDRMKNEYDSFWDSDRRAKCKELGFTPMEVTTLASIVKAECAHNEEAPVIAGLYINRLKRNMALQADPTVIYANHDFTIRRVLDKHKEIDSPYNTYKYAGLPPGPINMPDIFYIDAVLNYTRSNYLYMCAREDFSEYHNFTDSYAVHLNNARKYTAALNKERIYR